MSKIVKDENVIGISNEEEKRVLDKSFSDVINHSQPRNTASKQETPLDIIPLEDPERKSKASREIWTESKKELIEFLKVINCIKISSDEQKTTLKEAAHDLIVHLKAETAGSNHEGTVDVLQPENLKKSSKSRQVKLLIFTSAVLFVALSYLVTVSFLSIYSEFAQKKKAAPIKRDLPYNCDEVKVKGRYVVTRLSYGWKVLCDTITDNGGWFIIQKRTTGEVDFFRNWYDYRYGFGNLAGDFWFGLEYVYQLTKKEYYELRVELSFNGRDYYVNYRNFRIHSEEENYKLNVSGYRWSPAGDSLANYHNNVPFTTYDRDNDQAVVANCALTFHGAWWYKYCGDSNLNGKWNSSGYKVINGMKWRTLTWGQDSVTRSEMKIRPGGALICPEGFELNGTFCYKYIPVKKTYDQAVHECRQLEAFLAEPRSETENQHIIHIVNESRWYGNNIWIGVHDRLTETRFKYESTGKFVNYTDWSVQAPDEYRNYQHCVEIIINNIYAGFQRYKWNDLRCNTRRTYVCQAKRGRYFRK